jgi:tetratricopeptide (TPR) repeat protein
MAERLGLKRAAVVPFAMLFAFVCAGTIGPGLLDGRAAPQTSAGNATVVARLFESYKASAFPASTPLFGGVTNWDAFVDEAEKLSHTWPPPAAAAFLIQAAAAVQAAEMQEALPEDGPRDRLVALGAECAARASSPPDFELRWLLAAYALIQGTGAEAPFVGIVHSSKRTVVSRLDPGTRRWRDVPELALDRALIETRELHLAYAEGWFSSGGRPRLFAPRQHPSAPDLLNAAVSRFRSLIRLEAISAEAHLNLGFVLILQQEEDRAMASLEAADRLARDAHVRYLSRFLRARVLADRGDLAGAVAMFRLALEERPAAASAGRALAALYFVTGDRVTAERLIAVSLGASVDDDPWPSFAFGTFRLWPERLERLLESLR